MADAPGPPSASATGIDASVFALGPEAFVETCAVCLGLGAAQLSANDREILVAALAGGRPRMDVIDALRRLQMSHPRAAAHASHFVRCSTTAANGCPPS
jgi:hypothetical protein